MVENLVRENIQNALDAQSMKKLLVATDPEDIGDEFLGELLEMIES